MFTNHEMQRALIAERQERFMAEATRFRLIRTARRAHPTTSEVRSVRPAPSPVATPPAHPEQTAA